MGCCSSKIHTEETIRKANQTAPVDEEEIGQYRFECGDFDAELRKLELELLSGINRDPNEVIANKKAIEAINTIKDNKSILTNKKIETKINSMIIKESKDQIICNSSELQLFKASKDIFDSISESASIKFKCIINYEEVNSKDGAIYCQK